MVFASSTFHISSYCHGVGLNVARTVCYYWTLQNKRIPVYIPENTWRCSYRIVIILIQNTTLSTIGSYKAEEAAAVAVAAWRRQTRIAGVGTWEGGLTRNTTTTEWQKVETLSRSNKYTKLLF